MSSQTPTTKTTICATCGSVHIKAIVCPHCPPPYASSWPPEAPNPSEPSDTWESIDLNDDETERILQRYREVNAKKEAKKPVERVRMWFKGLDGKMQKLMEVDDLESYIMKK